MDVVQVFEATPAFIPKGNNFGDESQEYVLDFYRLCLEARRHPQNWYACDAMVRLLSERGFEIEVFGFKANPQERTGDQLVIVYSNTVDQRNPFFVPQDAYTGLFGPYTLVDLEKDAPPDRSGVDASLFSSMKSSCRRDGFSQFCALSLSPLRDPLMARGHKPVFERYTLDIAATFFAEDPSVLLLRIREGGPSDKERYVID